QDAQAGDDRPPRSCHRVLPRRITSAARSPATAKIPGLGDPGYSGLARPRRGRWEEYRIVRGDGTSGTGSRDRLALLRGRPCQPEHLWRVAGEQEFVRPRQLFELAGLDVGEKDLGLGDELVADVDGSGDHPADVTQLRQGGRVSEGLTGQGVALEVGL